MKFSSVVNIIDRLITLFKGNLLKILRFIKNECSIELELMRYPNYAREYRMYKISLRNKIIQNKNTIEDILNELFNLLSNSEIDRISQTIDNKIHRFELEENTDTINTISNTVDISGLNTNIQHTTIEKYEIDVKMKNIEEMCDDIKQLVRRIETEYTNLPDKKLDIESMHSKLQDEEKFIDEIYNKVKNKSTTIENNRLAHFFYNKSKELREELQGNFKEKFFWIIPNIFKMKIGCSQKFGIMIFLDILVTVAVFILNIKFHDFLVNMDTVQNIRLSLFSAGILGLLFWGTKYFNRRTHETIHLIEEYEHKALVLSSFIVYSTELERLSGDDKKLLLDYISKVSSTINKSPSFALNKKKSDNSPVEDITDLLSKLTNLANIK